VLGTGPVIAGFTLAAMSVGWPIASTLSGRAYMRVGFRDTALAGSVLLFVGCALSALLTDHSSLLELAGVCFVIGAGLGLASTPVLVALQSVVGWDRRGVVTGTNMFFRSMGSAVGAAVFGAIANTTLTDHFAHPPAGMAGKLPHNADATSLVLGGHLKAASGGVAAYIRDSLFTATHYVFLAVIAAAALGVLAVLLMPRRTTELAASPAPSAG
jgi:MFS family permease